MIPEFHLHPDVLALVAILAVGWWWLESRLRPLVAPTAEPATPRKRAAWYSGVALIVIAAGWPIHDIAEEVLFTFHMIEHLILGYVVPPLLLVGIPTWMGDYVLGRESVARVLRPIASPVAGFFAFNTAIVAVHWPEAITWQNTNEWAHFLIHLAFFTTAIMLWLPLFSPTEAIPTMRPPMKMLFLFLCTIIPTVPASFLTFSDTQLYPTYGDLPLTWGLTAVQDQTTAGIIMKLAGAFYLLGLIAVIWFRWIGEEREWEEIERSLVRP